MKLACIVEALGEVLLRRSNMLILNAFCQRTPWWVSVAHHCVNVEGLSNHRCLYASSTAIFFSLCHFQIEVQTLLSLIFLFPKKYLPSTFIQNFSFNTTYPSISAKSNFSFKFRPHAELFDKICRLLFLSPFLVLSFSPSAAALPSGILSHT